MLIRCSANFELKTSTNLTLLCSLLPFNKFKYHYQVNIEHVITNSVVFGFIKAAYICSGIGYLNINEMRNLNKFMLTAAMVVASTFALANNSKPYVKVERSGAKAFAVIVGGQESEQMQIKLKLENGSTLYSASTKNGQDFGKRIDLNNLVAGDYTLEVENKESFISTPIVISNDSAFVNIADQVTIMKPVICQNGERVDIIMPNEAEAIALVTIYDSSNRKLKTEEVSNKRTTRFDLTSLEAGTYTLKVETKGKFFMQSVSIK